MFATGNFHGQGPKLMPHQSTEIAYQRLRDAQNLMDRLLETVFEADVRRLLTQVQVHVEEALFLLTENETPESGFYIQVAQDWRHCICFR
jgi:hypothetical protein